MTKNQKRVALVAGVAALLVLTAGASAYVATEINDDTPKAISSKSNSDKVTWNEPRANAQPAQPAKPKCNDGNVVGAVVGGVGGGVVGSQIGSGSGQTAATIGGTLGGAYLGKEFIPTENVTCAD